MNQMAKGKEQRNSVCKDFLSVWEYYTTKFSNIYKVTMVVITQMITTQKIHSTSIFTENLPNLQT